MATYNATHDPVVEADYPAHVETYRSFLRGVQLAVATAALVLALLGYFLL
jgi:hypothetical protein